MAPINATPLEIAHLIAEGRREVDMQSRHLDTPQGRQRLRELIAKVDALYADLIEEVGRDRARVFPAEMQEVFRLVRAAEELDDED